MQKLKEAFFSEKGMGIVNTLFCISAIFRKGWLTVAACLAWAVYLFFCRKHAAYRHVMAWRERRYRSGSPTA